MGDPYREVRAVVYPSRPLFKQFEKTFFYLEHWNTQAQQMLTSVNKCFQMFPFGISIAWH